MGKIAKAWGAATRICMPGLVGMAVGASTSLTLLAAARAMELFGFGNPQGPLMAMVGMSSGTAFATAVIAFLSVVVLFPRGPFRERTLNETTHAIAFLYGYFGAMQVVFGFVTSIFRNSFTQAFNPGWGDIAFPALVALALPFVAEIIRNGIESLSHRKVLFRVLGVAALLAATIALMGLT